MYETGKNRGLRGERYLVLVQVTTAEPVSYAKSRPCFERGMARDAVASATRDAGDIRCEVGIAPVFSWSLYWPHRPTRPALRPGRRSSARLKTNKSTQASN